MEHQPLRAPILRAGINDPESKNTFGSRFPPIIIALEDASHQQQPIFCKSGVNQLVVRLIKISERILSSRD